MKAKEVDVDVLWKGTWYKAEVLAKRDGKSLIHYIDFSRSFDEWVTADRIKLRGALAPTRAPPPKAIPQAEAGSWEGLYYRTAVVPDKVARGNRRRTYPFWFRADGNVLGGSWEALVHFLANGDLQEYQRNQGRFWGTYQVDGGTIVVTWTGGREERFETEESGGAAKIKGLQRAYPVKAGLRLDGKYQRREAQTGGDETSGTSTLLFRPDMTVRYEQNGVTTTKVSGLDGGEVDRSVRLSEVHQEGPYTIDGYRMFIDSKNDKIFPMWVFSEDDARSDSPRTICLGNEIYYRQD